MKRLLCVLGVLLGMLGTVLCVAGTGAVWWYYPSLIETTERVQTRLDESLNDVGDRLETLQTRVAEVNAATLIFRKNLDNWLAENEVSDETIRSQAGRLSVRVRRIEDRLVVAQALLQKAQAVKRFSHPFAGEQPISRIEELQADVGDIQQKVSGVADKLETISQQLEDSQDRSALAQTMAKVVAEVIVVMKTLEVAEERLTKISERVAELRESSGQLVSKIQQDLWWACLILSLLMFWVGIGQIALAALSRRGLAKPV